MRSQHHNRLNWVTVRYYCFWQKGFRILKITSLVSKTLSSLLVQNISVRISFFHIKVSTLSQHKCIGRRKPSKYYQVFLPSFKVTQNIWEGGTWKSWAPKVEKRLTIMQEKCTDWNWGPALTNQPTFFTFRLKPVRRACTLLNLDLIFPKCIPKEHYF